MGCIFCTIEEKRTLFENPFAYAIYDKFPVTQFHTLVIPKRHVATYFQLNHSEIEACTQLLKQVKQHIETNDLTVTGFNIGINDGATAGQTIFHCHIHLIPRRKGDVANPKGGVRQIIPGKGVY